MVAASWKEGPSSACLFCLADSMVCISPLISTRILTILPLVVACASLLTLGVELDDWVQFGLVSSDQVALTSAVKLISKLYLPQS